jgi:F0F1-type ATP synthase membrane subunit b/b'
MLRQKLSRGDPEPDEFQPPNSPLNRRAGNFDIQAELNRLEEIILDSPRIPLTKRTLIDEEQLLDQLDLVRLHLPAAFEEAVALVRQKEEILLQAEEYAQDIIAAAQQRAAEILDELGIVRQAELEASQIRRQVQQECEQIQQSTLTEIEQLRRQARQEIEQLRRMALDECEDIQDGADEYADAVLSNIEQQLSDMLRIIRNGRQQLHNDSPGEKLGEGEEEERGKKGKKS